MTKVYEGQAVRALFAQLVRDFGGVEAAAALLNCSKGTVSRETTGSLPVSIGHFCALEDALGRWPITRMLADRCEGLNVVSADLAELAQQVITEQGDVAVAIFQLLRSGDTDNAAKELREAIEAGQRLLSQLEREQ